MGRGLQQGLHQPDQFHGVVLGIPIGIEHPLLCRGREAGAERSPVPPVPVIVDDAQFGIATLQLLQYVSGVVLAAVIHDNDFVVIGH